MDEENKPEAKQPPSPPPVPIKESEPIDTTPAAPATAQQLTEVEKQMSSFERATLRWAKVAVFMSALAAFFVCAQWVEMCKGGQDTKAIAEATKRSAYAACISAQTARSTLQEIQAGSGDSHNLAIGSILQAAAVTREEAAQEQFSISGIPMGDALIDHGYMGVLWGVDNVGRTPANNVRTRIMVVVVNKGSEPDFRYGPNAWTNIGTQPPVGPVNLPIQEHLLVFHDKLGRVPEVFSRAEQLEIISGTNKRMFFYARVDYRVSGVNYSFRLTTTIITDSCWNVFLSSPC